MVNIVNDSRVDLIPNSFSPRIVIFSSEEVNQACKRNRLSNFASLLQPFQSIPKVSVRHSNYASIIRPSFPLSFIPAERLRDEVNEIGREDDSIWLDRSINKILTAKNLSKWLSESSHPIPIPPTTGPFKLKEENEWINESILQDLPEPITESAPWYNAFLKSVLDRRLPTVFDTSSHPIAALIVVSTNDPEPLNEFAKLYEESNTSGLGWPNVPWLDTEPILRYYVLLHETTEEFDGGRQEANQLLQSVSRAYGLHCGIVCMNSEKTEYIKRQRALNTDPHFKYDHSHDDTEGRIEDSWAQYQSEVDEEGNEVDPNQRFGECMAQEDILGLKVFLREFTIQSLVPHMERCVQHWNESLSASRKGITGRLFSVGRKYFSKPDSSGSSSSYNPTMRWYPYQSTEFQTRRLADYAFMLGDYKLASQMYEYVRKDALGHKAWSYYLSSTHMVGLCSLLLVVPSNQTFQNFDPYSYLFDPAALSQMSVFDSLRITLIYHEACKSIGESKCMASSLLQMATLVCARQTLHWMT
ncbi:uncharacterized protein MELLADRAFT_84140 [Melampsora larici-populina 98AG31]|uniref:Uncharacterized protein n=1 Tax=Melampsora larici-populina (strain 98AG31 / pathotype 3-4-7) TaxID=747676 RepID=F4SBM4_MELLP|nr:uncharacterized protein MELLADRAFT_84140 [Melampsora larici-populina 98AG31]EGF97954.1 hypothetical protein MELLADRAFT_84140 [Melampsora larici-populina 98AG31]